MKRLVEPIAFLLLFTLVGAAIGFTIGCLIVPTSFDLGGPFFGSREGFGPTIGGCCSAPFALAGLTLGAIWLSRRSQDDGEALSKEGEEEE
jgi:hypothetical protein